MESLTAGAPSEGESLVVAVLGDLPHLPPLPAATQRLVPHIVVATDRLGAQLIVVQPDDADRHVTADATVPVRLTSPHPCSSAPADRYAATLE